MQNKIAALTLQRQYTNEFVKTRYKQGDTRKMSKKMFLGDIESAYTAGILGFIEELFKEDIREEYKSKDEMMGDIQLVMIELFNHFRKKHGDKRLREITLDDFLSGEFKL